MPPTAKRCPRCDTVKPAAAFRPQVRRSGRRAGQTDLSCYCIECEAHDHRERTYGLTVAQYQAMYEAQARCCPICGRGLGTRHAVDHDHVTGQVRALLCRPCNVGLGHFEDDPDRLAAAQAYLLARRDVLTR